MITPSITNSIVKSFLHHDTSVPMKKKFDMGRYDDIPCLVCGHSLRIIYRKDREIWYGCTRKDCNLYLNSDGTYERINPYTALVSFARYVTEDFYGDSNPLFGKLLKGYQRKKKDFHYICVGETYVHQKYKELYKTGKKKITRERGK